VLAAAGVSADTPATVLCDGDAGLWRLQRGVLPAATIVLDWWHVAVRFKHALQAARGLGAGTADAHLASEAVRGLERAKWRLWPGRWTGCRHKLAALCRWTTRKHVREVAGIDRLRRHVRELLGYLERNQGAPVHYAARRRRGEPISTAFMESAINEIVAKRMNKQQTRWSRATVQPFLDVRTAMLNDTLEDAFRCAIRAFGPPTMTRFGQQQPNHLPLRFCMLSSIPVSLLEGAGWVVLAGLIVQAPDQHDQRHPGQDHQQ